jgi:hypothetical protein
MLSVPFIAQMAKVAVDFHWRTAATSVLSYSAAVGRGISLIPALQLIVTTAKRAYPHLLPLF